MITEPFQGLAAGFAATLGMPGYPAAVVPHPVSSQGADRLARMAREVADAVARDLLGT